MKINFSFLTGDCNYKEYYGTFISKEFNHGDFSYRYVLDCNNIEGSSLDCNHKYSFALSVVAPEFHTQEIDQRIKDENLPNNWRIRYEMAYTYCHSTLVWQDTGNNWDTLFKEAKKQAVDHETFFGFMMDRPQNAFGATGWDVIQGNVWGDREN